MLFTTQIQKIINVFLKKSGNFRAAAKNLGVSTHTLFRWNDGTLLYGIDILTILTKLGVQVIEKRQYFAEMLERGQNISEYKPTLTRVCALLGDIVLKYKPCKPVRAYLNLPLNLVRNWVADNQTVNSALLFEKLEEMGFCLDIYEDKIMELLELIKETRDVDLARDKGKIIEEEINRLQGVLLDDRKEEQKNRAILAEQHRYGLLRHIKRNRTPEIDPENPNLIITVDLSLPRGELPFDIAAIKRIFAGASIEDATHLDLPPEEKEEFVLTDRDFIPPSIVNYIKLSESQNFDDTDLNRRELLNLDGWQERALGLGVKVPQQGFSNKEIHELMGELFPQEDIDSYYSSSFAVLDHEYLEACFHKDFLRHVGALVHSLKEKETENLELKKQLGQKPKFKRGSTLLSEQEELQFLRRQNEELASKVKMLTAFMEKRMGFYKDFQDAPLELFSIVQEIEEKKA